MTAVDAMLARGMVSGMDARLPILPLVALLYGVICYPILPAGLTLVVKAGLVASAVGVGVEFSLERALLRSGWVAASLDSKYESRWIGLNVYYGPKS